MKRNPTAWTPEEKEVFRKEAKRVKDAETRLRYLAILHWADGYSIRVSAATLQCDPSTVQRARQRFRAEGSAGLADARGDNGSPKITDEFALVVQKVVSGCPPDYGYPRTTWTLELLVKVLAARMGVQISISAMSRLLRRLGIRRGMPKPTVGCPWSERSRKRRIRWISRLVETLPPDEVAVYEDELDVHLNPKIGPDYMLSGQQKTVLTPGKNEKRYVAGAMDARTRRVTCVHGRRKDSWLFVRMLDRLVWAYKDKTVIHVILDNYVIHRSRTVQKALHGWNGRIVLHFLPPYCPDDNKIERGVWREVHANVTRNHRCATMDELMAAVSWYLAAHNRRSATAAKKAA